MLYYFLKSIIGLSTFLLGGLRETPPHHKNFSDYHNQSLSFKQNKIKCNSLFLNAIELPTWKHSMRAYFDTHAPKTRSAISLYGLLL